MLSVGQSGATVSCSGGTAQKLGDERVRLQGDWLFRNRSFHIVRLYDGPVQLPEAADTFPGGWSYTMERLAELPQDIVGARELGTDISRVLRHWTWKQEPNVPMDWKAHIAYVQERAEEHAPEYASFLHTRGVVLSSWDSCGVLPRCLTHGDPTFANAMLRGRHLVMTDPLPATPHMGDVRAVDIGKILQSAFGYEVKRFRWKKHLQLSPGDVWRLAREIAQDSDEAYAAMYFAAVHFVRLLPYTPDDKKDDMKELLGLIAHHS